MSHPALPGLAREPNVVPMIDVLLVLLIIFMIAQAGGRQALDVQLPEETRGGPGAPPIVLSVEPGPRYAINGTAVTTERLTEELRLVYEGRPEKVLFVRGDPRARYQEVVSAFDAARGAGVRVTGVVLRRP